MEQNYLGILLKQARLERNWNQTGLCRGICAVSYLSKIENGTAEASEEILRALFQRVGLPWLTEQQEQEKGEKLEHLYRIFFWEERESEEALTRHVRELHQMGTHSLYLLDIQLLMLYYGGLVPVEDEAALRTRLGEFEACMDSRQQSVWCLLQGKYLELLRRRPSAFSYGLVGKEEYARGQMLTAIEYLQHGYTLAAEEAQVYIMMECQTYLGNCYSNQHQYENMQKHYAMAARIARAVGAQERLKTLDYNMALGALNIGRPEVAYSYFAALREPDMMDLHKLSIVCEQLGRPEEALAALERTHRPETPCPSDVGRTMGRLLCDVVDYRLRHEDYLQQQEYGDLLLQVYDKLRRSELPSGFAGFHIPWIIQWYEANRQYKAACELLRSFPEKVN